MSSHAIFLPALAMVALTFIVLAVMFSRRVAQMKRDRIHPQKVATSQQAAALYTDVAPADNFRNLFEMPVLFYLALVVAALTAQVSSLVLGLAWAYVIALVGADHAQVQAALAKPANAIALALFAISLFWHARLGLQVVVEDYFHHRPTEIFLQLLITFACALGALASLYAIGRIALLA